MACDAGHVALGGNAQCLECGAGTKPAADMKQCEACPAGRWAAAGSTDCTPCDPGLVALNGSSQCSFCPGGEVPSTDVNEVSSCVACGAGKYAETGAIKCSACGFGFHAVKASSACSIDYTLLLLTFLSLAASIVAWVPVFGALWRRIRIADVSNTHANKSIVKADSPHGIIPGKVVELTISGSGGLVSGAEDGCRFRAQVLDSMTVELVERATRKDSTAARRWQKLEPSGIEVARGCWTLRPRSALVSSTVIEGSKITPSTVMMSMLPACLAAVLIPYAIGVFETRNVVVYFTYPMLQLVGFLSAAGIARARREKSICALDTLLLTYPRGEATSTVCNTDVGRAVATQHLQHFAKHFAAFLMNRNIEFVDANIVRALTKPTRSSFAELVGPRALEFYVSYCSRDLFVKFVEAVSKHAASNAKDGNQDEVSYWASFLSTNPWEEQAEKDLLATSLDALRDQRCRGICLVFDSFARPLNRPWCLFEVFQGREAADLFLCSPEGVLGEHSCYASHMALSDAVAKLCVVDALALPENYKAMLARIQEDVTLEDLEAAVKKRLTEMLLNAEGMFKVDIERTHEALNARPEERETIRDMV
eukprot:TRINITY_DN8278_c0_g1_i3.p1 TRINITY_DN8278_c0_g1~~TRINITY_DN8278_c0_g1_i3.p1  ORF type:complete len:698 (-),score=101.02 TRINITY_DN8278_c0_g1_i3:45-1829(-)